MKKNYPLINEFCLENFRVFKEKSAFELAPITVLTGANSAGKSSVIKALKLMHDFYQHNGRNLSFQEAPSSGYHHQLGDFEMTLNNQRPGKKEMSVTYKIPLGWRYPINYWGDLFIEHLFSIDKNSQLKNGHLESLSVYIEDKGKKVLISQCEGKSIGYGPRYFNIPLVIEKFKSLQEAYPEYKNKIEPYIVEVNHRENKDLSSIKDGAILTVKDYTGPIICTYTVDEYQNFHVVAYHPEFNQQFADFMGFDLVKLKIFEVIADITGDWNTIFSSSKSPFFEKSDDTNVFLFNTPKILDLVAQIPLANYDQFEQHLWDLLVEKDPSVKNSYSFESFFQLFEKIDAYARQPNVRYGEEKMHETLNISFADDTATSIQAIKDFIAENSSADFNAFYKEIIQKIQQELSYQYEYDNININDAKHHPNSWNLHSIIKYFFILEFSLERPDLKDKDYDLSELRKSGGNIFQTSALYTTLETAEKEFYKLLERSQEFFTACEFIESVKTNAQRLYTFSSQGTSFNEFLSKFINDYKKHIHNNAPEFINKWLKNFNIGKKIDYQSNLISGVGTQINIVRENDTKINIVDLGYGVTQFLALLLRIADVGKHSNSLHNTIVIEEPETNLHPKYQSQLADLFIDAHREFGINFILETHSEYLIRKLQYLTAKGEIKPEDTVMHYIGDPDKSKREPGEEQVRTIHIKPNGQLTKPFGSGFIDESSIWIKGMFGLPNFNRI